ncbi:MAG: hypothetical protein HBSIN02_17000 [Bacteroidia bacterium]|nr:MAG: hypothetical protein HBSIN02_17000 [Bacteroidia bacterium]
MRVDTPPRVDGVLSEPQWQRATPTADFIQYLPLEGQPATQSTEVRILYDHDAIYVGATMRDSDPSRIVARLARRDDEVESDWFSVRFDSYHDHQTAFEFTVNAAGVKTDILISDDGKEEDASWDVVWDAEVQITPEGWSAELRIPFKVLRFPDRDEQEWGVQFVRYISRLYEVQHWVLIGKSESGFVSKFGHLTGLSEITRPGQVEVLPYVVGGNRFVPKSPAFPDGNDLTSNAGFDVKIRPTTSLTIDATFNPDFGQVEADPAVLNLSTIETFYPEKRPFFIEGSQIFRLSTFGGPGLFYSRRVGRAIDIDPPPGGYIESQPRTATIVGAAKISGKTESGLSIGVLEAVTAEEEATFVDSVGNKSRRVVEPLTNFTVVRLRQDVMENSNAGMMITTVQREGRIPAFTGGLDWNLKFDESTYRLDGFLVGSHTSTPSGNILDGSAGSVGFAKDGGPHWRWNVGVDFTSKGYNINDVGFFRRPNDYGSSGRILYRDDEVTGWKRIYNVEAGYHYRYNFDGANLFHQYNLNGYIMLPSFWEINIGTSVNLGKYDDRETRGNGLFRRAESRSVGLAVESDPREAVVGTLSMDVGGDSRNGSTLRAALQTELKLATSFTLTLLVENNNQSRQLAWVTNLVDTLVSPDLISIVGERTTKQWDFTMRGSFIFARDLTLQAYLQVFFAKGRYENFMRMTAPDQFVPYVFSWPDFNRLSLNSNLVLRWEYLPGSTLFLVWSQARQGDYGSYATSLGDDFGNVFSLPMSNVLLLKVSYWFSI